MRHASIFPMKIHRFLILPCLAAVLAAKEPAKPVVLIGDSITNHGDWDKVLGRTDVLNWGIPGYTTGQLAWTFKDVEREHPEVKIVFLQGGINDLTLGVPADRVYQNYVKAIKWWRDHKVTPVVESVILQVNAPDKNADINSINRRLVAYCAAHKVDYLNLNSVLSVDGHLRAELSIDGTHLKPPAYKLWAKVVLAELNKLGS
ncbi:GDSL-like lipase/acylhydrolase [mine drainage metagenome]|uniref:GDSL-like lipase/acylhydrolase n=1 Tax=mine drainage metagenome TaxID=410659 RepID=A0A1J5RKJ7_9ZZZZ